MGADWTYGVEGKAYPVEVGQVWSVGRHTLVCSDLMASKQFDQVLNETPTDQFALGPRIVYSDPPWNQGNVNSFRTKAGLAHAAHRWKDLYRRVAEFGFDRRLPVWVEASSLESRDGSQVRSLLAHPSSRVEGYWPITYGNKNDPCGLFYAGPGDYPLELTDSLTGVHDAFTPEMVLEAYGPVGLVIEPCCGLGTTPLSAQKSGWYSMNNELNPHRCSVTLSRLAKATGLQPEQVA